MSSKPVSLSKYCSETTILIKPDEFAVGLGYPKELARSLIKLQIQNLSTMDADWMYASYHFSHPILAERLTALGWYDQKKVTGKSEDSEKPIRATDREL